MNFRSRFLAIGALFFVAASAALADPVSGSINVSGHDTFTTSALTFISPFASLGDSGVFSGFTNGTVDYYLGTVPPLGGAWNLKVFSVTDGSGNVLTFFDDHNAATPFTDSSTGYLDLTLDETGYYTINGGPGMAGFIDVTFYGTSATGSTGENFSSSGGLLDPAGVAPEPSSYLLLGTAIFALAGAYFYSRRRASCILG
jgi:hypothetical protein